MTTRREWERRERQEQTLQALGFTREECDALRRISNTLRRWHEAECGVQGGCIERDEKSGRPYWRTESGHRSPVADREAGAKKRLAEIIARRNSYGDVQEHANGGCTISKREPLTAYIQGDPRGAALYILRPGDVPAGESADSCYSRGICVY